MKKLLFIVPLAGMLVLAMALGISSCKKVATPTQDVLEAYLAGQQQAPIEYDTYSAYFDLSDGMLAAYSDPATKGNLEKILNKVTGNKKCTQIYGLKNDAVEPLDVSQTQLYNYIMDRRSYSRIAPIERTLAQITSADQAAFLLTDFEEYNAGKIHKQNYAKQYFIDWVEKGRNITFFVIDYKEGRLDKHLYLTVFDSQNGALLKDIEDALSTGVANYTRFSLNNYDYTIETAYDRNSHGGVYRDKTGYDAISSLVEGGNGDKYTAFVDFKAEYYPFEEDWQHILKNISIDRELTAEERDGEVPFENLISGLTLNFQPMSGYDIEKLDIKVANIEEDFDAFEEAYEDKLKGEEDAEPYKPQPTPEVFGMFAYTGTVADNVAKVSFNVEADKLQESDDLLRVDVVLAKVGYNLPLVDRLFSWGDNNSLRDAVVNTLQACNPEGKVVYTFILQSL